MYIVYNKKNEIIYYNQNIYYVYFDEKISEYVKCEKELAQYIYIADKDELSENINDIAIIDNVISDFKPRKYLYKDGKVLENDNYIPYISESDRISALEDMVNMLLGV